MGTTTTVTEPVPAGPGQDAPVWHLRLFDGWELSCAGRHVPVPWREQRLLALLGLQGDRPRAHVAGMLWPDSSEARAMGSLRAAVWQVQHLLPGLLVEGRGPLALSSGVRVDVHDLLACLARTPTGDQPGDLAATLRVLRRGDLLPGWYDDWVLFERERLQQLRLRALETLADRLTSAGLVDHALAAAMTAVAIEPLRESSHRALIRVHLTIGNHADALRVYERFRARLRAELGIAPSPQIGALVRPLLVQRVPVARRRPPGLDHSDGDRSA